MKFACYLMFEPNLSRIIDRYMADIDFSTNQVDLQATISFQTLLAWNLQRQMLSIVDTDILISCSQMSPSQQLLATYLKVDLEIPRCKRQSHILARPFQELMSSPRADKERQIDRVCKMQQLKFRTLSFLVVVCDAS